MENEYNNQYRPPRPPIEWLINQINDANGRREIGDLATRHFYQYDQRNSKDQYALQLAIEKRKKELRSNV